MTFLRPQTTDHEVDAAPLLVLFPAAPLPFSIGSASRFVPETLLVDIVFARGHLSKGLGLFRRAGTESGDCGSPVACARGDASCSFLALERVARTVDGGVAGLKSCLTGVTISGDPFASSSELSSFCSAPLWRCTRRSSISVGASRSSSSASSRAFAWALVGNSRRGLRLERVIGLWAADPAAR